MNVLNSFNLTGQRALITGSSAGIGLALAEALAQARAKNQHWLDPALTTAFPESGAADYRPPSKLAVLLPQSGNLAVAGNAIRDGSGLLDVSDFPNAQDFISIGKQKVWPMGYFSQGKSTFPISLIAHI